MHVSAGTNDNWVRVVLVFASLPLDALPLPCRVPPVEGSNRREWDTPSAMWEGGGRGRGGGPVHTFTHT